MNIAIQARDNGMAKRSRMNHYGLITNRSTGGRRSRGVVAASAEKQSFSAHRTAEPERCGRAARKVGGPRRKSIAFPHTERHSRVRHKPSSFRYFMLFLIA